MRKPSLGLERSAAPSELAPAVVLEEQNRLLPYVIVGNLVGFRGPGLPLVDFPSNISGRLLEARSILALTDHEIGMEAVLMFEEGDPQKPIVIGLIRSAVSPNAPARASVEVTKECDTLVLTAEREIVLRCGKASITLASDGRVSIRGSSLLSRSSGPNRIKGASIQLN